VYTPTLVEALCHVRAASVSCGAAHTLVATAVIETATGHGPDRMKLTTGGSVYAAGSASALGTACDEFTLVQHLEGLDVRHVSAGYAHSGVITGEGELYTWGNNRGGCCGHPLSVKFQRTPACVDALYK
jgi:Regulator of chromosome condensation (RCC1) repeat